ncbi:MAG: hypothetical protein ABI704_31545 [Kofleriaceae bacterium]
MADGAAHLVDHLLPRDADYRQWTLSLPHGLCARALRDKSLASAVLAVFVRGVFADLRWLWILNVDPFEPIRPFPQCFAGDLCAN